MGYNVKNLERSKAFYGAALAPLGHRIRRDLGDAVGYGTDAAVAAGGDPHGEFWIMEGEPQEPRIHLAFTASSHQQVRDFHAAALAAGGRDNGAPGYRPRYHTNYYAAFVIDPDGYNIEAACHRSDAAE
jgi:catechol 2,3-dioxygenase-like lactoylglutathione lyase family enzyme